MEMRASAHLLIGRTNGKARHQSSANGSPAREEVRAELRELYGWSLPEFAHDQLARAHTRLFALTTKLALSVWIEN